MKKVNILFSVVGATVILIWLMQSLVAAGQIVRVEIPQQRIDLDIDNDGMRDQFRADLTVYEDGIVDGGIHLIDRFFNVDTGRLICDDGKGKDPKIYYTIYYTDPDLAFELLTSQINENTRGKLDIVLDTPPTNTHQFEAVGDLVWVSDPCQ